MAIATAIKAARLAPSSLQPLDSTSCSHFAEGFCRRGQACARSHEIKAVPEPEDSRQSPTILSAPNYLSFEPRQPGLDGVPFENDGPGCLSFKGPRHDNDYVEIRHVRILPTTDEILSRRFPYMPKRDPHIKTHLPCGRQRYLDMLFRYYRYENVKPLIDACYCASQQLSTQVVVGDYDDRCETGKS